MSISGFSDQFLFYGFLPKTEKGLEKIFISLSNLTFSQIFFVPAIKINFYIKMMKKFYKGRSILIAREITKIPIVAIGGINFNNYKKLLLNKANFLAISGYIWNNKKLKPIEAIKKIK